jgi:hypothetical protein
VDLTKKRNKICEVHETKMRKGIVQIAHGCFFDWPSEEEKVNYPHRKRPANISIGGYKKVAIVYICPKCNKAARLVNQKK